MRREVTAAIGAGAPTVPDLTGCYVGSDGEEDARLYDTRTWTSKYRARRAYARDLGEPVGEVHARVIYARWLTRQEVWDDYGRERWEGVEVDEAIAAGASYREGAVRWPDGSEVPDDSPAEPPAEWQVDDDDPAWASCKRTDDGAVRCWRVEWAG